MVEVTNPQPGEIICDPACGTGGFFMRAQATMREFVKEMLYYNLDFHIEASLDGETWLLRRKHKAG